MFEGLTERIDSAIHRLSGRGRLTDIKIAETVKEIRRAFEDFVFFKVPPYYNTNKVKSAYSKLLIFTKIVFQFRDLVPAHRYISYI